jgi:hypothetical protein
LFFLILTGNVSAGNAALSFRGGAHHRVQHQRDAKSGLPHLFHEAIRRFNGIAHRTVHHVLFAGLSEKKTMEFEEKFADATLHPKGLNMIPGG